MFSQVVTSPGDIFDDGADDDQDCMRWNVITPHKSWDPLIPEILSPGRLATLRYGTGDHDYYCTRVTGD